ncbi:MAG: monooxygenase [Euryarchaeota archaeon]|nr:monooxygenase [Euryarchaeota archaeon]
MPKELEGTEEKINEPKKHPESYDVIVVGAGAAGIGVAITLIHAGIENFIVVDRKNVGASFYSWPDETRFITPSFPSNSIGMLDLNSIAIGVSPAFTMKVEHPTGKQFASHLQSLAKYLEVPVQEKTEIKQIEKVDDLFHLNTDGNTLLTKNLIWAAGEFLYPTKGGFVGSELCRHTATIPAYRDLEGDNFLVIGGYESGVDAAYHLARRNKKVSLFDKATPWEEASSDPSVSLSTYSFERIRENSFTENVDLFPNTLIDTVTLEDGTYEIKTKEGLNFKSKVQPLLATGFEGSHKLISHLFEQRDDGFPLLSDCDESTIVPGIFLCGPSVRHDNHDFCFIYKFRQRFAIVAQAIASSFDLPTDEFVDIYKSWGMYLDDLSCCGQECLTC